MEAFFSRKRRRVSPPNHKPPEDSLSSIHLLKENDDGDEESTDVKLATLASLYPYIAQEALLDSLIAADGSVEAVSQDYDALGHNLSPKKNSKRVIGYQTSLAGFRRHDDIQLGSTSKKLKSLTRKGQTLHLYTPEDIANHTPCSIIHNFLPSGEAEELLMELLEEAPSFPRQTFKLFDNVVQSPHTQCFYVDSLEEQTKQKTEYLYNGSFLTVGLCSMQSPTQLPSPLIAEFNAIGCSANNSENASCLSEGPGRRQPRDCHSHPNPLSGGKETRISIAP